MRELWNREKVPLICSACSVGESGWDKDGGRGRLESSLYLQHYQRWGIPAGGRPQHHQGRRLLLLLGSGLHEICRRLSGWLCLRVGYEEEQDVGTAEQRPKRRPRRSASRQIFPLGLSGSTRLYRGTLWLSNPANYLSPRQHPPSMRHTFTWSTPAPLTAETRFGSDRLPWRPT